MLYMMLYIMLYIAIHSAIHEKYMVQCLMQMKLSQENDNYKIAYCQVISKGQEKCLRVT